MTTIQLYCRGSLARAKVEGQLTHAMAGIPVEIQWDEAWHGLTKTMKIRCNDVCRTAIVAEDGTAVVPYECLIAGQRLEIGLDGWSQDGSLRIPSSWASCGIVKPSVAQCEGEEGAPPTVDTVAQLQILVGKAEEAASGAALAAGDAAGSAGAAGQSAMEAGNAASAAGQAALAAAGSCQTAEETAQSIQESAERIQSNTEEVNRLKGDVQSVKYLPVTLEGKWDYTDLPVTDGEKTVVFQAEESSPFYGRDTFVLQGQNFFPFTQKFNKASPQNGISFEQVGRLLHISGTAVSGGYANFYWMNGDSISHPFPEHLQPGENMILRTIAAGTTLNYILLMLFIYDENGNQLLAKNHDCSKSADRSTTITVPEGASYFRIACKVQSTDQTTAHDRFIVAAMYKADETVVSGSTADGSAQSLSLFPIPASELHYSLGTKEYIDYRVSDDEESLTSESLGYLTPEMYGAIGDDYTDDTQALQDCINDGFSKKLPVRGMRRYLTGAPITITGEYADMEINQLRYTGTDTAITMDCGNSRLSIRKLTSSGVGVRLSGLTVNVSHNEIDLGDVSTASHCISLTSPVRGVYQNHIRFRRLIAGGEGCCCITTKELEAGAGYITEQTYEGGQCRNADYAFYGYGGNSKFYNFQVENYIKGGYCFVDNANAMVVGDRHAEAMRDGEYPYLKIMGTSESSHASSGSGLTALRYISAVGLRVNEIDVSGVPILVSHDEGDALTSLPSSATMGVIDCQIDYYGKTGQSLAKHYNTFARRALIWGNVLIFQDVPYQRWQVTENLDLRTITEDTPSMPCVFDIGCANCEIRLHPSYCYLGISHFEVVQTEQYTAKIYDYYSGSCVFDGTELGEGTYEVSTWCSEYGAFIDGNGMEWGVRKIV